MTELFGNRLDYLRRIWNMRYFWFALVRNDLNNRYRRSFLGIGWSLLKPLSMTFVYCIVFAKVFNVSIAEYAPFLLIGMTVWQYFTECLLNGAYSFAQGSAYIRQTQIPLAIFPLRAALGAGFHALVALAVALAVTWFFTGGLHLLALPYLIPAMLILAVFGWSLAILSGVLFTHFPDTRHLLEVALQILFYVTPILYRPGDIQGRSRILLLLEWNPMSSILALIRTPILDGVAPTADTILIGLLFVVAVTVVAATLLRKLERNLIFWI